MTLLQLIYFTQACQVENFTKAADILHVTQPTVTSAIKELETEFKLKLIDREKKRFIITPEGRELYEMAMRLLDYATQIRMVMEDKADEKSCLLFGCPNMTNTAEFPELFQVIHKAHPDIEIKSTADIVSNLIPSLKAGRLHMIMTPYKPTEPGLRHMLWNKNRMLFCVSDTHHLAGKSRLTIQDISQETIISFFGDVYLHAVGIPQRYLEVGREMKVAYRCNQINTLFELVRRNEGCTFAPEHALPKPGVIGIPIEGSDEPSGVYLLWTKESERFQVVKRTLECVRTYVQKNRDP